MNWLIEHMRRNGKDSKKTLIYCRSIDSVANVYLTLRDSLGKMAYFNQDVKEGNQMVEMYHKSTHQESKERILNDFKSKDGIIRYLVATVALGMGVDVRDIDVVIHYGCPKSVLSYWQEAGRCARDGRQGLSVIYYDNFTLSLKSTESGISETVRTSKSDCIRKKILGKLALNDSDLPKENSVCLGCGSNPCDCQSCKCCAFCSGKCQCPNKIENDRYISYYA